MASFIRKNWLRTIVIIGLFAAAGAAPTIIEQQMLPLVQLSGLVTDYYNPLSGDLNIEDIINNIVSINVLATSATQTTLLITTYIVNQPYNFYPMKIPALDLDLYYRAGRPYDSEKQIIQQFKADPNFGSLKEPIYDPLSYSWVRTMNIIIPNEVNIPVGTPGLVNVLITMYTNGQDENALSQMISTIIREEKIPSQRLFASGNVFFMGVPVPISLEIPEFAMPTSDEEGAGLTDLLSTFFLDMVPETDDLDFFHLADIRNYDDQNRNFYRDWNDTILNGLKDEGENFTEPLLENGTISATAFLRLTDKLSIGGGSVEIPSSPWNVQEGQNQTTGLLNYGDLSYWDSENIFGETRYTPKTEIENTVWGTAEQQLLLYVPGSLAERMNQPNWRNRIIGAIGFNRSQSMSLESRGSSVPLLLSADIKITGDARPNANFTSGDAINTFIPQLIDYGNVSLGIVGNIKVKLGEMPLSLTIKLELEQDTSSLLGGSSSSVGASGLSALQNGGTSTSSIFDMIFGYFSLNNILFNGLAMDVYNKIMQVNSTLGLDLFFPYGIYFPDTPEEAEQFLSLQGGPIQIFNQSKPGEWGYLNQTFPYNKPDVVINEDFESYTDDNAWQTTSRWTIYNESGSDITLDLFSGKLGSRGLIYNSDGSADCHIENSFSQQLGISGFYFDVKINTTQGEFTALLHNSSSPIMNLTIDSLGNIKVNGLQSARINNNTDSWYRIFVTTNSDPIGTFDVTIAGIVNETHTGTGAESQFWLPNIITSGDIITIYAINEQDAEVSFDGNDVKNNFAVNQTLDNIYYVMINESFDGDGTTSDFTFANIANTTGATDAIVEVLMYNATNSTQKQVFTHTAGVPSAGYEYTRSSQQIFLYNAGVLYNPPIGFKINTTFYVEEDNYDAITGNTVLRFLYNPPADNATVTISFHTIDRPVFTYTTSPSTGYQYRWNPTYNRVDLYLDGSDYLLPLNYELFIDYNLGTVVDDGSFINNFIPTNLTLMMNDSYGPIYIDNVMFRNAKTLEEAQKQWYQDHLLFNLTIETETLKDTFAKILSEIGSYRNGMGIAYHFNSRYLIGAYGTPQVGYYSQVLANLNDQATGYPIGTMPTGNDTIDAQRGLPLAKVPFEIKLDDLRLNIKEIFPQFGDGASSLLNSIGINPSLISYLNKSLDDWGVQTGKGSGAGNTGTLADLLLFDLNQFLKILYQDGPANDLFDFMIDQGFLNETYSALNLTALVDGALNLLGADDLMSGATGGEDSEDLFTMLPELLQATNINFDDILPGLIDYLIENMSYENGVKLFELLDVALSSTGTETADIATGIDDESWFVLFDNLKALLNIIDPMELAYVAINNPLPFVDYLNRSSMLSEYTVMPLIESLFSEMEGGEEFDWDKLLRNAAGLIEGLLFGVDIPDGITQPWENKGINLFAMLQAPESIQDYDPFSNQTITLEEARMALENLYNTGKGLEIQQVGEGNYIADTPPYDNLRVVSTEALALMLAGFTAEDIYQLLADLGILDLTQLGSTGGDDMFSGINALLPILGMLVPPGEWMSILREMGIWSTWDGDWDMMVYVDIWGMITIPINVAALMGRLVNLEKLLATGIMEILPDFPIGGGQIDLFNIQLSLNENQSYGNPYFYQTGYDTSSTSDSQRTGPWRQKTTGLTTSCDNWGWVPMGWDPGGPQYGSPLKNYSSDTGDDYPRSVLSKVISNLPISIDLDIDEIDIPRTEILRFGIIFGDIVIDIEMTLPIDLAVRLRMEGNPASMVKELETAGMSPYGFLTHLYPNPNQWIYDMFGDLAGGGGGGGTTSNMDYLDKIFNNLDLFVDALFTADTDLMHTMSFLLDPDFMKGSRFYLDPSYMVWDIVNNVTGLEEENPAKYTLYWDYDYQANGYGNVTQRPYFGDGDEVPDEYPWYRFFLPSYNQLNPHRGPGTYLQADIYRYPLILDQYTPLGYPGQGYWLNTPDGTPDGVQHYWYDTPYAYINTTPSASDPWPNVDPDDWANPNGNTGSGYYQWTVGGTTYYWGENAPAHPDRADFPYEQVPLVDIDMGDWATYAPLYYGWASNPAHPVYASGEANNNFGTAPVHTSIQDTDSYGYPDIWASFAFALDQTDYRFGYWEKNTTAHSVDNTPYDYLNCLPFWTLLSLGVTPHLSGAIDFFDIPGMMTDVAQVATANLGSDYWHKSEYNRTYRWFEPHWDYIDNKGFAYEDNVSLGVDGLVTMNGAATAFTSYGNPVWTDYGNGTVKVWNNIEYYGDLYDVDLNPFGLLQWIWDGASDVFKLNDTGGIPKYESYMTKYLAPYSTPNLKGALEWLADKGFTIDHILNILPTLIEDLSSSAAGSTDMLTDMLGTETIVNFIKSMEDYYRRVPAIINRTDWALNHDPNSPNYLLDMAQNRTRAAELILEGLSDFPEILDINPAKAARGALSYLMPRVADIFGTGGVGGEGGTEELLDGLNDLLHDSGLVDIIFEDTSKIRNLALDLSIQNTMLNLTFMGWKFIDIQLDDLEITFNLTEIGEALGNEESGNGGGDFPIELPLDFASPFPYIELSTFNGPYEVTFQALNASSSPNPAEIAGVDVSWGQVYYWADPDDPSINTYYFNVTMYDSPLSGWYNESLLPDIPPNAKLYIHNVSDFDLTHTNATGHVTFYGNIGEDNFGWVDPYVYVHVEPIDLPNLFYYWWNVTTISTQLTLGGHQEIQKARWVTPRSDGKVPNIVIQTATPFDSYVTDIDNDGLSEIFARVEIDNNTMSDVQKIFFMPNGTIDTINVSHALGYDIDLWADSNIIQNDTWDVDGLGGQTKYTFSEEVTPDGSNIVYPVSPKLITGIQVNSGTWIDDSLTKAQIYYYDIEDEDQDNPIYLLNWDIRENQYMGSYGGWVENLTGSNRLSMIYPDTSPTQPETLSWTVFGQLQASANASRGVTLVYDETTYGGQQYTNLYRICDLDLFLTNVTGANRLKTLTNLELWYYDYYVPEGDGYGSKKQSLIYSYNGKSVFPGTTYTINRELGGNPTVLGYTNSGMNSSTAGYDLIWNGPYHHRDTGAHHAYFTYVFPIPSDAFISEIFWNVTNLDDTTASGISITNLSAFYGGTGPADPNRGWKTITTPGYGGGGVYSGSIYSQTSVGGTYSDPWSPGHTHHLYLTSRGQDTSETWEYLMFEVYVQDDFITGAQGWANLGWNDTDPPLADQVNNPLPVTLLLEIRTYDFLDEWGMNNFELPEGLISGFKVIATMWDPQEIDDSISPTFYPNFTVSYKTVRMEDGSNLFPYVNNSILTPKVYIRLDMEDSIVNEDVTGGRGDTLYVDHNRTYGYLWQPLQSANLPYVTTNSSILNVESEFLITVNVTPDNALRNYYLNLTLPNSRGYIEPKLGRLIVISNNPDVQRRMGTFPPKVIIDPRILNATYPYPHIYRLGTKIDLDPTTYEYSIEYHLTFRVSALFLKDWRENYATSNPFERFYFSCVWDKPRGTFESITERYIKATTFGPFGREEYREVYIQT